MLSDTLEIRWFLDTLDQDQALDMIRHASGFEPMAEATRTDHYLRLPLSDRIGIKRREGCLEHKWLLQYLPGIEPEAPLNRFGCWRKWSVPTGDGVEPPGLENWIAVQKQRWINPWTALEGRAQALPQKTERVLRCDFELAQIEIESPKQAEALRFWTLCFESEGPERQALLESVLRIFRLSGLAKLLVETEPKDYPTLLREHSTDSRPPS
ncbi:MAG: hypothetical protein ACLFS1_07855 [Opitutales bacterium]